MGWSVGSGRQHLGASRNRHMGALGLWLLLGCQVTFNCLRPHRVQHTRLPWSLSPRLCSDACPLSRWYHPTIPSCATFFSSSLQIFVSIQAFPSSSNGLEGRFWQQHWGFWKQIYRCYGEPCSLCINSAVAVLSERLKPWQWSFLSWWVWEPSVFFIKFLPTWNIQ